MKNNNNRKQDIAIAEIKKQCEERTNTINWKITALDKKINTFINNDFQHLRQRVDWILWIFILGTLVTIAIGFFT